MTNERIPFRYAFLFTSIAILLPLFDEFCPIISSTISAISDII